MVAPVMKPAAGLAVKTIQRAISSGFGVALEKEFLFRVFSTIKVGCRILAHGGEGDPGGHAIDPHIRAPGPWLRSWSG